MKRILALLAFAVLVAFLGILARKVPEPDLIAVIVLTLALAGWDLATSSGKGRD